MTISVFYDRMYWPSLISHVILPFYHRFGLSGHSIYFSSQRGDHITFVPPDSNADILDNTSLLVEMDHYIIARPSQKRYNRVNDLFQDFQNNSIHFNIDSFVVNEDNRIASVISGVLLREASSQIFDNELAYSILISLLVTLLCTYFAEIDSAYNALKNIKNQRSVIISTSLYAEDREHTIGSLASANKELVSELIREFRQNSTFLDNLWIAFWLEECKELSNELSFEEAFQLVCATFCLQTDLVENFTSELLLQILCSALRHYKEIEP